MGNSDAKRARARQARRRKGWNRPPLLWAGGAVLVLALLLVPSLGFGGGTDHPEPRDHVDHTHVAPAARYAAYPRVAQIYARVAEVPHVVDGIYCYCACSDHSGHYSLLDCFRDDHAARCDVCLSEADMAYRMHREGRSLDEIRTAIDRLYET